MAYTRQYTQGVGWENEPSINTPISAENLNQMDAAIQDVDEAAYNEFLAVYAAIAQAGGGNAVNFYIDNASNNTLASDSSVLSNITLKKDDIIFLYMSVDGDYTQSQQPGWEVAYKMYVSGTLTTFSAVIRNYLYGEGAMWHDAFNLDLASGTWLILRVVDTTHFDCIGKIDPASAGGDSMEEYATYVYDDEIVGERHKLILRNKAWGSTTPTENALLFLRIATNSDIVYGGAPMLGWVLKYVGSSAEYNVNSMLLDFRNGKGTNIFNDTLQAGSILVLAYWSAGVHACDDSWGVLAVIPAASGGGTTVVANPTGTATDTLEKLQVGSTIYEIPGIDTAWAGKVTAVSGGNITPNNASFSFDPFTDGKFVILDIGVDAVMPGGVTSWSLQYTVDGNTVTRGISDKRDGNAYDPDFDDDLVSGSVIVLQYFGDNKFACVAVLDQNGGGGASTLAGLSDTTISSPTAAQPLTYDAANRKWVNGGIIPAANGGTGNNSGYIRTGIRNNTTVGTRATAEGNGNQSSADDSHAEGANNNATGNQSHAEGYSNTASGNYSHAEGANTTASGYYSHAEGMISRATHNYAHAEGCSVASAQAAHSEGEGSTASAFCAHAGGNYGAASGSCSFSHGSYTNATAECSVAMGRSTNAGYVDQFAVGKYNNNKSTSIFEVGIGADANTRANGLELDTSGNLKVAGTVTDGDGNSLSSIAAQLGYLEQTVTLSTSASTTVTFTDLSITANSFIEYACSQWDLVPESITAAAGSCTIVLPKVESAQSVTVRIYVR